MGTGGFSRRRITSLRSPTARTSAAARPPACARSTSRPSRASGRCDSRRWRASESSRELLSQAVLEDIRSRSHLTTSGFPWRAENSPDQERRAVDDTGPACQSFPEPSGSGVEPFLDSSSSTHVQSRSGSKRPPHGQHSSPSCCLTDPRSGHRSVRGGWSSPRTRRPKTPQRKPSKPDGQAPKGLLDGHRRRLAPPAGDDAYEEHHTHG